MSNTIVQRNLPIALSRDEKVTYGKQLADLIQRYGEIDAEKKVANATFKQRLDELKGRIAFLASVVTSGEEWRPVDCTWQYDFPSAAKTLVRLDTGQTVETKPITAEERQLMFEMNPAADLPNLER